MFEGTIPFVPPHEPVETGALRDVAWPELVAKFAAARDLRALYASASRPSEASFAPGAALALAVCANTEPGVNPDALADGKGAGPRAVAAAGHASDGDRETQ